MRLDIDMYRGNEHELVQLKGIKAVLLDGRLQRHVLNHLNAFLCHPSFLFKPSLTPRYRDSTT